jgi:hypothetical protein
LMVGCMRRIIFIASILAHNELGVHRADAQRLRTRQSTESGKCPMARGR